MRSTQNPTILETDVASRRHLVLIAGFILLLFGGFAAYGTMERARQSGRPSLLDVGAPAPVSEDRAAFLAQRRVWFKVRQAMAKSGKDERWTQVIAIADNYLRGNADVTIHLLRAEAMIRSGHPQGTPRMAMLLTDNKDVSAGERALLRGDRNVYRQETQTLIARLDETSASALDANNAAWQAAVGSPDDDTLAKAIRLSERAVNEARRSPGDTRTLALYTNTLGGLYVRAGRYDDALRTLSESERLQHDPFNAPFLALAYARRGDREKALAWRDRLRQQLNATFATREAQENRQELLLLWRETEQTVQETPARMTNENYHGN